MREWLFELFHELHNLNRHVCGLGSGLLSGLGSGLTFSSLRMSEFVCHIWIGELTYDVKMSSWLFDTHMQFLGRDKSEPRFALGWWFIDWCVAECCIVFLTCNILMWARHTHVYTRGCNSVYVLPYVNMHIHVYMQIDKYVYTYRNTCKNTYIYMCFFYAYTYIHTYIDIYMHKYIYVYIAMLYIIY